MKINESRIEDLQDKIFLITKNVEDLCILNENLRSKSLKKIIETNLEISTILIQIAGTICNHYNKNIPNYDKLVKELACEFKKNLYNEFGIGGEYIQNFLSNDYSITLMKSIVKSKYTLQKYIADIDILLLELIVSAMDFDYLNIRKVIDSIIEIIGDNAPVVSDIKNTITTIKNIVAIVNEFDDLCLEKQCIFEFKKTDEFLIILESKNDLLLYIYAFVISFTFIQNELNDK